MEPLPSSPLPQNSFPFPHPLPTIARGERLKEATADAKRVIDGYREEKEKQFKEFVKTVRWIELCLPPPPFFSMPLTI